MTFDDAALIARVLSHGDSNAFGELVRRYQSPVRGFLLRMVRGDTHSADDLAQETFLKAWSKLGSFRGASRFSTWLFGIALNEFRNASRDRGASSSSELPATDDEPAPTDHHHLRMDLAVALDGLPDSQRAAVILCCQQGLSHDEAARVLHCPLGTVKSNILRGKDKLRRQLCADYETYEIR